MNDPKAECEELMHSALPFAEQMLAKYGEFFPFGATMSASGVIANVAGATSDEHPPSAEIMGLLEQGFREGAREGKYRATALVYDALVVPPGGSVKQDAIAVRLDHRGGYSVVVFFPYTRRAGAKPDIQAPFATAGQGTIFPR